MQTIDRSSEVALETASAPLQGKANIATVSHESDFSLTEESPADVAR